MVLWKLSDARLVRRSQRGDSSAFVTLLQRFDDRLRELVYALVVDEATMDRVLRAAYLKAWRDVVRTDSGVDVGVWLYRLAYNAAIDELRRQQLGWNPSSPDTGVGAAAMPATPAADGTPAPGLWSDADRVAAALAAVPPDQRVPLVLVDREEFTPAAAARIFGLSQETFDDRLSAARAGMSQALARLPEADVRHGDDDRSRDREGDGSRHRRRSGRRRPAHRQRPVPPATGGAPEVSGQSETAVGAPETAGEPAAGREREIRGQPATSGAPEVGDQSEAAGVPEDRGQSEAGGVPEDSGQSEAGGVPEVGGQSETAAGAPEIAGEPAAGREGEVRGQPETTGAPVKPTGDEPLDPADDGPWDETAARSPSDGVPSEGVRR